MYVLCMHVCMNVCVKIHTYKWFIRLSSEQNTPHLEDFDWVYLYFQMSMLTLDSLIEIWARGSHGTLIWLVSACPQSVAYNLVTCAWLQGCRMELDYLVGDRLGRGIVSVLPKRHHPASSVPLVCVLVWKPQNPVSICLPMLVRNSNKLIVLPGWCLMPTYHVLFIYFFVFICFCFLFIFFCFSAGPERRHCLCLSQGRNFRQRRSNSNF